MLLIEAFQSALNEWDWDDEIEHDESDGTDFMRTSLSLHEQSFSFVVWTDQARQWIGLSLRSPLIIPEIRRDTAAILCNFFNAGMRIGKFVAYPADGGVCFEQIIDIEGSDPTSQLFSNLRIAAESAFGEKRFAAFVDGALTDRDIEVIIGDFLEAVNPSE